MKLQRRFTPLNLLLLSINGMVGSAWLFAPFYAAQLAGSAAIMAWLVGGIVTATIALTFVELSVLYPVTGGSAQFPQLTHGALTSFTMSWVAWLSALTMAPIEVQAILQYASTYFTSLMNIQNGVPVLSLTGLAWAAVLMLALCVINIYSYKGLMRFNRILFTFKVAVIVIAIIAIMKVQFNPSNFADFIPSLGSFSGWHNILTAVSVGGVAFAFTGFKHGVELAGEAQESSIAIPLAIIGSIFCCLLLYVGLQIAFVGALNPNDVAKGWRTLSFVGDIGPFAGLAAGLGLFWLMKLLYIDASVSPAGAGLIYVTSTARILYAMARIGYLPKWLLIVNKQHFPVAAIFVNFILGMCLFLPLPGWQAMVSFLVSGMVLSYAMGPISVLCLRKDNPEKVRHFRLPFVNVICLVAFYFCNLLSYWTGWDTIYKLAIAIGIGLSCFVIACIVGSKKVNNLGLMAAAWLLPYIGGLVLISYLGAFGGKNVITFGPDFLVIALFSALILYLAVKMRTPFTEASAELLFSETAA